MAAFVNSDGLLIRFGRDSGARGSRAAVTTSTTKVNELVLTINLAGPARTTYSQDNNNDGTVDGFGGLDTPLPAGARILRQEALIIEAPAGDVGSGFTVGTFNRDGTAIDADGIRLATGANGAQVGTQLAADGFVAAVTTGNHTAGIVKLVIEYVIR